MSKSKLSESQIPTAFPQDQGPSRPVDGWAEIPQLLEKNMSFFLRAFADPRPVQRALLLGIFLALCLLVLNRYELANGFTVLSGDGYDAVIVATILEHWFHVLSGHANWSQVSYFFPYTRTIAQTDAYFLLGVAYYPFRFFGLDPFLSAHLAGMVMKPIGFIGTYLLCRKVFSLSFYWALLAAILFTLCNALTIHNQRVALASVALAPILGLLMWSAIKALLDGNSWKFTAMGLAAGLLFGAWCLTCFYMAWYFAFFFIAFAVAILVRAGRTGFTRLTTTLSTHAGSVLFVLASTLASLLPFIYAFYPKSLEVGVRSYDVAVQFTLPLVGILQVGHDNILFGPFYNYLLSYISPSYLPNGEYYNLGFTPVLFFLFLCGCIQIIRRPSAGNTTLPLPSVAIAALLTWLLTLSFFGHSGWFFVYKLFPGAKALHVVSAYQIFLALPVTIIAVHYLSTQRLALPLVLLITVLLIAEEVNRPYLALNRQAELARISVPHAPPKQCQAFYVSGWKGQENRGGFSEWILNAYPHNVSAMMIAQITGIPTINGMASFNPPDWNFAYPNKLDYDQRVIAYARKHDVTNLCRLDLNSKQWSIVDWTY